MYVCAPLTVYCLWKTEEGIGSLRTGVAVGYEPLDGRFWESRPGPLEQQPVLFTTEPLLQLLLVI